MSRRTLLLALELTVPLLVLAGWWIASERSRSVFFPPLRSILEAFANQWVVTRLVPDILPSLGRLLAGLALAVTIGIGLGVVLGSAPKLRQALAPIVEFLRALPAPVLVPFGILTLGTGDSMKVAVIALGCLWPILLNTVDGVRGLDITLNDTSRVYGLRRGVHIRKVVLPAAGPQIFAGVRTAVAVAVILMVLSEMVVSTNGIGYRLLLAQRTFAIAEMWAGILLLGVLGYGLSGLLTAAERRVLRWHLAMTAGTGRLHRRVGRTDTPDPPAASMDGQR